MLLCNSRYVMFVGFYIGTDSLMTSITTEEDRNLWYRIGSPFLPLTIQFSYENVYYNREIKRAGVSTFKK